MGGEIKCNQAIVYGETGGKQVTIFLDTGSAVSMVSKSLIDKLGLGEQIGPCELKLKAFGKTDIKHLGQITMTLKVAGIEVNSNFVVSDQLNNNFLLGYPEMKKNNLAIDLGKKIFTSPKKSVKIIDTPPKYR